MAQIKQITVSSEGLKKLKEELEYLKTIKRKEVAENIKTARSFGDLSENSEYDEARNEQAKLYARMDELEGILANYEIVSAEDRHTDIVCMGSTVTVDYGGGDTEAITIVVSVEADPMNGKISEDSLFGKAIVGKRVGDTVSYSAPMGVIKCTIVDIE